MPVFDPNAWNYSTEMLHAFIGSWADSKDADLQEASKRLAEVHAMHGGKAFGLTICEALVNGTRMSVPAWVPGVCAYDQLPHQKQVWSIDHAVVVRSSTPEEDWLDPRAGVYQSTVHYPHHRHLPRPPYDAVTQHRISDVGYVVDVAFSRLLNQPVVRIARGTKDGVLNGPTSATWDLESTIGLYATDGTPIVPLMDRYRRAVDEENIGAWITRLVDALERCRITFGVQLETIGLRHLVQIRPSPVAVRTTVDFEPVQGQVLITTGYVSRSGNVQASTDPGPGHITLVASRIDALPQDHAGLITNRPIHTNSSHGDYYQLDPDALRRIVEEQQDVLQMRVAHESFRALLQQHRQASLKLHMVSDGIVGQVALIEAVPRIKTEAVPPPRVSESSVLTVQELALCDIPEVLDPDTVQWLTFHNNQPLYVAQRKGSNLKVLVHGQQVYGAYDGISPTDHFKDGEPLFVAWKKERYMLVLGHETLVRGLSVGDDLGECFFDGTHIEVIVKYAEGDVRLYRDGTLHHTFDSIYPLRDGDTDHRIACNGSGVYIATKKDDGGFIEQKYVVHGETVYGPFSGYEPIRVLVVENQLVFSYTALRERSYGLQHQAFVQWGDRRLGPFPAVRDLMWIGGRPVFVTHDPLRKASGYVLHRGHRHEGPYEDLKILGVMGDDPILEITTFQKHRSRFETIITCGKQTLGPYDDCTAFRIVDGKLLFFASRNGAVFVVCDGVEGRPYPRPNTGPMFDGCLGLFAGEPYYVVKLGERGVYQYLAIHGDDEWGPYRHASVGWGKEGLAPYFSTSDEKEQRGRIELGTPVEEPAKIEYQRHCKQVRVVSRFGIGPDYDAITSLEETPQGMQWYARRGRTFVSASYVR